MASEEDYVCSLHRNRAYAGDDDGSVYLQALSTYLKEQYKIRSLDKIYLMVKQAMIKCEQVSVNVKFINKIIVNP